MTSSSAPGGYCSAVTPYGWRWIVDAHCNDGKRYIVQSDELLTSDRSEKSGDYQVMAVEGLCLT